MGRESFSSFVTLVEARHTPSETSTLQAYETHGRGEIRRHWTLAAPLDLVQKDAWAQLRCVGMVENV